MNPFAARTFAEFAASLAWARTGRWQGARIGRRLIGRPFPARARRRILLAYWDDPLAYPQFQPFFRYAPRFATDGVFFRAVPATRLNEVALPAEVDAVFVQYGYTPAPGELAALLGGLRGRWPDASLAYFDWFAPTDIRFAEQVVPWADHYVKKSLLRDRAAYLVPTIGHTNLSDHYAARLGTENPPCEWTVPAAIIDRLAVSPAFSTGADLIGLFERGQAPEGPRPIDLHARTAINGSPWYSAMRREADAAVHAAFGDLAVIAKGRVSRAMFMKELGQSKLCFSPFGYGEICWRDFEAIATGSVLVKPDMAHVEADPDIYRADETYIPVRWDLADLDEKVRAALAEPERLRRIARNAFAVVRDHLRGPALGALVERLATPRAGR